MAILCMGALASAGTVTLTGTCTSSPMNTVVLNISNSGTESATNMNVVAKFIGISLGNSIVSYPKVSPGSYFITTYTVQNATEPGTYAGAFVANYSQGESNFSAVFPCIVNTGAGTRSSVYFSNVSARPGKLTAYISNNGSYGQDLALNWLLPSGFSTDPNETGLTIAGNSMANYTFSIYGPVMNSSTYVIAAALSYSYGGLHYASIYTFTLGGANVSAPAGSSLAQLIPLVFIGAVIVAILALIAYSVLRKGRGSNA